MNYLTDVTTTTVPGNVVTVVGQRVARLTLDQIVNLDTAEFRAQHAAAQIRDFEFRVLPADDETLRYNLFRQRCTDPTGTAQSSAAYFTPRLILDPMRDGATFAEALAAVVPPHQHDYETTTVGDIDPITRTGTRIDTQTCTTCGHTTTTTTSRNRAGD